MRKEFLLEVQGLSCERNYKLIFKNISFSLLPGGVIFVNGDNGSGKTSLLLTLSGVLSFSGKIKIKEKYKNKGGYVGHKNALNESETVKDFLYFWKRILAFEEDINHTINYFELKKILNTPIGLLSFGQKKKLCFSRLQMTKSKIWLLDEPISGLDKKTKFLILKLITDHLDSGGGAIITSHQPIKLNRSKNIMSIRID